jgi:hypothetical protein
MSQDDHLVKASKPVNRRLMGVAKPKLVTPKLLQAQISRIKTSSAGGPPLAQMLAAKFTEPSSASSTSGLAIGSAVGMTAGVVIGGLGALQGEMLLMAAGGITVGLGCGALLLRRMLAAPREDAIAPLPFNGEALARFDTLIEQCAAEIPKPSIEVLMDIKSHLARMAPTLARASTDEHFRAEQRMYLNEVLRRYVPDSLEAFLSVPQAQRQSVVLENGSNAEQSLNTQLTEICAALEKIEVGLARSAARGLEQQDAFLKEKHR